MLKKLQKPILDPLLNNLNFKFIDEATFDKLSSEISLNMVVLEHLNDYMKDKQFEYFSEKNRQLGSAEKYGRLYEAHYGPVSYTHLTLPTKA